MLHATSLNIYIIREKTNYKLLKINMYIAILITLIDKKFTAVPNFFVYLGVSVEKIFICG